MTEFEFYEWKQADSSANQNNQEKQAASSSKN